MCSRSFLLVCLSVLLLVSPDGKAALIDSGTITYGYLEAIDHPDAGYLPYFDDTGRQLLDGQRAVYPWYPEHSNYEWVGYRYKPELGDTADGDVVQIIFNFGQFYAFESLTIGTLHASADIVYAPDVQISALSLDGVWREVASWVPPISTLEGQFTLNLGLSGIVTDKIILSIDHNNKWVFLDEVTFSGERVLATSAMVPDGRGTVALLGMALVALHTFRRRV